MRALLREISRAAKQDLLLSEFARGLMQERTDNKFRDSDIQIKEKMLLNLTDLISLSELLGATPAVREALAHGEGKGKVANAYSNSRIVLVP